jgi:hypothetical protein
VSSQKGLLARLVCSKSSYVARMLRSRAAVCRYQRLDPSSTSALTIVLVEDSHDGHIRIDTRYLHYYITEPSATT